MEWVGIDVGEGESRWNEEWMEMVAHNCDLFYSYCSLIKVGHIRNDLDVELYSLVY